MQPALQLRPRKPPHVSAAVAAYDSKVFDGLYEFHAAKQLLAENRHHIPDLGQIFVRHGVHETFALSLLHKHFDLAAEETLYRTFDRGDRAALTRPVEAADDAVPYLWKLAPRSGGGVVPLEFERRSEAKRDAAAGSLERFAPFLTELAEAVEERALGGLFGVATMNILRIPLAGGQILVEETDSAARTLLVQAEARDRIDDDDLTETLWGFAPVLTAEPLECVAAGAETVDDQALTDCMVHCTPRGHCLVCCRPGSHCLVCCKPKSHCLVCCRNHPDR